MERRVTVANERQSEALAWDEGCRADPVRNKFLIPEITTIFLRERPASILDIGAATGYIARSVQVGLDYLPEWTLIDIDGERLAFAELSKPAAMQLCCLIENVEGAVLPELQYDAVLLTFTLLEAPDAASMITNAAEALAANGLLIVAVPDVLRDVVFAARQKPNLLDEYLQGSVKLHKTDRFTGSPYPFYAWRLENVLASALSQSCVLERLERGGPNEDTVLLVFRKQTLDSQGYVCG